MAEGDYSSLVVLCYFYVSFVYGYMASKSLVWRMAKGLKVWLGGMAKGSKSLVWWYG